MHTVNRNDARDLADLEPECQDLRLSALASVGDRLLRLTDIIQSTLHPASCDFTALRFSINISSSRWVLSHISCTLLLIYYSDTQTIQNVIVKPHYVSSQATSVTSLSVSQPYHLSGDDRRGLRSSFATTGIVRLQFDNAMKCFLR